MSGKPFISVMMLCYNYAELLKKALEACAKQTFKDYEIVMINNGSTDDTEAVFFDFCERHPEIETQYVNIINNQGPTNGWNEGLKKAKGEYILFNDADDWMEPNCLDCLAKAAKQSGADRIVGQYQEVMPNGTVTRIRAIPKNSAQIPTTMLQATAFKKEVLEKNSIVFPIDILVPYDAYFTFKFANTESTKPFFVRETIYNYYYNPYSITQRIQQDDSIMKEIEKTDIPLTLITKQAIVESTNSKYRDQMEYLCIRNSFAAIVNRYRISNKKTADLYCEKMLEALLNNLPTYRKNKLIRPFFNGYETAGSFATWLLVNLNKCKLLKPFCKIITNFKFKKLLRETTEDS